MHMFEGHWGGWMMMGWWIFIIPLLILLLWWGMAARRNTESRKVTDPLDTLKERFARGEIDEKEFEEKKKTLQR